MLFLDCITPTLGLINKSFQWYQKTAKFGFCFCKSLKKKINVKENENRSRYVLWPGERKNINCQKKSVYFNEFSEMLVILDLRKSPARQERRKLLDIVISIRVDRAHWKANLVIYIPDDVNMTVCTKASVSTLSENASDSWSIWIGPFGNYGTVNVFPFDLNEHCRAGTLCSRGIVKQNNTKRMQKGPVLVNNISCRWPVTPLCCMAEWRQAVSTAA